MTNLELDEIIVLAGELWPKAKPVELKILRGMMKDVHFEKAKAILEGARISENVQMLPLKTIKSKLDAKTPAIKSETYKYIDCFFVCTESDGSNEWMYPGAFRELAIPDNYTEIEIQDLMRRYVQYQLQPYYGLCQFEFFIGKENLSKARKRSEELRQAAYYAHELPARFYGKPKELAEYDPKVPDSIPF